MFGIRSLVPGFARALSAAPGQGRAWRSMGSCGTLSLRLRALLAVAIAREVGGDYAHWAMTQLALRQGVSEEDAFLASVGCAHDAFERGLIRYAVRAVQAPPEDLDREDALLRGVHEALAHAVLTARMLATLEPRRQPVGASRGARP